jgi:hypothetical protein
MDGILVGFDDGCHDGLSEADTVGPALGIVDGLGDGSALG